MSDIETIRKMVAELEEHCALLLELVQRDAAQLATVTAERDEARRERDELRKAIELSLNEANCLDALLEGTPNYAITSKPSVKAIQLTLAAALNTEGKQG